MTKLMALGFTAILLGSSAAFADEVSDAIEAAQKAYEAGDMQTAKEELLFAHDLIKDLVSDDLATYLPEPPAGWTRDLDQSSAQAMAMGGAAAVATYASGEQDVTITLVSDSPMTQSMRIVLSNPAVASSVGKRVRINRERFHEREGEIIGLIDDRILVSANAADIDAAKLLLEAIDYGKLADFDR